MLALITGTPGTGKSMVANVLASELGCSVIESSEFLRSRGAVKRDPARDTMIIEWDLALREASAAAASYVNGCAVVSTVTPLLWLEAAEEEVAFIVLLRCHPKVLLERLESRGWPRGKIVENVLAEAFGSIAEELEPWWHSTFEVDTSRGGPSKAFEDLMSKVERWETGVKIDWLALEDVAELVARLTSPGDLDEYRLGMRG